MAGVNIALELFGMAVTALLLLCSAVERPRAGAQERLLTAMLAVNLLVLLCDAATWLPVALPAALLYALNSVVYAGGYVITALFTYYLLGHPDGLQRRARRTARLVLALCLIAVGMVVVSLFNGMFFRFVDGEYIRGPVYWLSQVYPIGILIGDMLYVLRHRARLGLPDTLSLLSYGVLPLIAMVIQVCVYGITLLYIATTLSMLIIYITVHVRQGRRLQQRELELTQMNTAVMLSQIQPHFLFNALTAIKCICTSDPPAAEKAIDYFSEFLRGNMNALSSTETVPFAQELRHTRDYLELEHMRFGPRLAVVCDTPVTQFRVPTLTLQPIVENAVRHGVTQRPEGGTVHITTAENAGSYLLAVTDDGVGFDPERPPAAGETHIGMDNVRRRLRAQCGGTLTVESRPGEGTRVTIRIPKEEKK